MVRARRPLLVLVTLLMSVVLAGCRGPAPPRNLLVITVDTLRADRLGCYGYTLARTPHTDRLATEGVLVEDAVAAAPVTLPSHCTIFTGLLPPAHGVRDNGAFALGNDAVTLAEHLREHGYATQAFVSAVVLDRRYGLDQGFDGYDDELWAEDEPKLFMIRDRPAVRTADRASAWLESWAGDEERSPFFLWVHFFDPHHPYNPSAWDQVRAPTLYDAEIAGADRGVGRLVGTLEQLGVLDDTIVVFTSDHGESLGEHGEKTHAIFIYDATIRVPLIVRAPGLVPEGTAVRGPAHHVDIAPTVLAGLGLPALPQVQGVNLLPVLRGRPAQDAERPRYSESLVSAVGFGMAPLFGVRSGGWKLIRAPRPELYDLERDPRELVNRFPEESALAQSMDGLLDEVLADSAARAVATEAAPLDQETEANLRALGYLVPAAERESFAGMDPKDGIKLHEKLEDARHLAQQERWGEAAQLCEEILAETPRNLSARNVLALTLLRNGDLEGAEDQYLQSLGQDPGQFRVYGALGGIAFARGDLAAAESHYRAALELVPGFVEGLAHLGLIAALRGDERAARDWYDRARALDADHPRVHRLIGDLHYDRGEWQQALANYRRALDAAPDDYRSLIQAASAARHAGDFEMAESLLLEAGDVRPDAWIPPYNLSCLYAVSGDGEAALSALDLALERGLDRPQLLTEDPDLETLRELPEFQERRQRALELTAATASAS